MRIHIVWVKGNKVTLKILQAESFTSTSRDGLSHEVLTKCSLALNSLASSMYFSRGLLRQPLLANFLRASCEIALIFIACLILHQLNTKSNTIKSHKIQRNKLMQLQHFLSWNKANIKRSCKSQLYRKFLPYYIYSTVNKIILYSYNNLTNLNQIVNISTYYFSAFK